MTLFLDETVTSRGGQKRAYKVNTFSVMQLSLCPLEVLQRIFSDMPFNKLGVVSLVCNDWFKAAKESLFLKSMIYHQLAFNPLHWGGILWR